MKTHTKICICDMDARTRTHPHHPPHMLARTEVHTRVLSHGPCDKNKNEKRWDLFSASFFAPNRWNLGKMFTKKYRSGDEIENEGERKRARSRTCLCDRLQPADLIRLTRSMDLHVHVICPKRKTHRKIIDLWFSVCAVQRKTKIYRRLDRVPPPWR